MGAKTNKDKLKMSSQSKLTDFGKSDTEQHATKEANANSKDAVVATSGANTTANTEAAATPRDKDQLFTAKDEILSEIRHLKTEFVGRLDGVLKAIEETRKEVTDCAERVTEMEGRLSGVELEHADLKTLVENLQRRNKYLEEKNIDMEMRSRLNNLRLVGVPEGAEGPDMCGFLESWLPDTLELNPLRNPLVLERAHRVGPKRDSDTPPRTIIMRFLNYRQKEMTMKAVKSKKEIFYKNHRVRFYADVATEVHRQRKQFDEVRGQLRQLGVRHGIISPSTLVLTYKERVYKFSSPAEAKTFVRKIQQDNEET